MRFFYVVNEAKTNLININFIFVNCYANKPIMKKLLIFLLLFPRLILGNEIDQKLTIRSAIVYLNGAQLTSTANFNLPAGVSTIRFLELTPNIDPNSIQINGLGEVTISALNFEVDYLESKEKTNQLEKLEKVIAKKNREIALLRNAISGLQEEKSLLQANRLINNQNETSSLEKLKQYANYYQKRIAELETSIYDTNVSLTQQSNELQKLNAELQKLRSNHADQRGIIKLTLDAPTSTSLSLTVKYNVLDARWFPSYDIKTKNTNQPLSFHYKANVYQETGSDWKNVKLTLSTGDPNLNSEKPEVSPYYLYFINPSYTYVNEDGEEIVDVSRMLEGKAAGVNVQNVRPGAAPDIKIRGMASAGYEVAEATPVMTKADNITNTLFKIEKPYTIPSSKELTMVEIDHFSIPATYEYYAAPFLSNTVFLTATLKDWEGYDILPGKAKVYFDGNFAGTSYINPLHVEEKFVISLGIDPEIVAEQKRVNDLKDKSFFGSTRIVQRNYEVTLKNNKNSTVKVHLEDRIPISQNEEIKVDEREYGKASYDEKTGILTWDVNLSAKESQTKTFSYKVKYPKNKKVNLN